MVSEQLCSECSKYFGITLNEFKKMYIEYGVQSSRGIDEFFVVCAQTYKKEMQSICLKCRFEKAGKYEGSSCSNCIIYGFLIDVSDQNGRCMNCFA